MALLVEFEGIRKVTFDKRPRWPSEDVADRLRGEQTNGDGETRERLGTSGAGRVWETTWLARMRGQMVSGAEAELTEAAGVAGIPLELWDVPRVGEQRDISGVRQQPLANQLGHDSTGHLRAFHRDDGWESRCR